ncbi:MAG: hypothetical protein ABSA86_14065 [Oryzomonas sp.]|jgi:hypothetical protein
MTIAGKPLLDRYNFQNIIIISPAMKKTLELVAITISPIPLIWPCNQLLRNM